VETILKYDLKANITSPYIKNKPRYHQEIECNFVDRGHMTYLLGTKPITIDTGRWALYWAAVPHHVIHADSDMKLYRLTIPLGWFLGLGLPEAIIDPIMNGQMILDARGDLKLDKAMFKRWCHDLDLDSEERNNIVLLELEARLRRLSAYAGIAPQSPMKLRNNNKQYPFLKAKHMADYIAQYYMNPITVKQVAETVDLSRSRALSLFGKHFQMAIGNYIKRYRVAHAQRLLVTSDLTMSSIAMRSGFTSISQFYDIFKKSCDHTPKAYRSLFSIL
jgi:AraC family transcriptional regulator, melibiose operon regulatory protein